MTILESYIDCMQRGDEAALADLFNEYGVLHDSSLIKAGMDTLHLEGRMAVEMMFHHKFGFNGGPFPIHSVKYLDGNTVWYFITYNEHVVPVTAFLSGVDEDGKIHMLAGMISGDPDSTSALDAARELNAAAAVK